MVVWLEGRLAVVCRLFSGKPIAFIPYNLLAETRHLGATDAEMEYPSFRSLPSKISRYFAPHFGFPFDDRVGHRVQGQPLFGPVDEGKKGFVERCWL